MAYRRTEKVLASIEGKRNAILAGAMRTIAKTGMSGPIMETVARRANVSVGTVYGYFGDGHELKAAVIAMVLARDIAAIRAAIGPRRGRDALAQGIAAFIGRMTAKRRLMAEIGTAEAYRAGIRRELGRLIRGADVDGDPAILCAIVFGAVFEASRVLGPRDEDTLIACLLRALGVPARRRVAA